MIYDYFADLLYFSFDVLFYVLMQNTDIHASYTLALGLL